MFSLPVSLKRSLALVALCIISALLITGCSLPWGQSGTNSDGSQSGKPTARQLLANLQTSFRNVTSFHVVMQVQNPGPASQGQIQIRNADGDVKMPDKVKAQANITLSGQAVTVNLISIGDKQYITDPVTGQWRLIKGVLDPRTLTNPDKGILSLIGKVKNVSDPVSDTVNGTPCWRVTGQIEAQQLAFFTGGGVPAGTMLQTSACIGKADSLPYQLIVTGQAARGDTAKTERTFVISNYNKDVTITAPPL